VRVFWRAFSTRVPSTLVAGVILWVVLALVAPTFLTSGNLTNIAFQSASLAILALGVTLVIGTGEIDLSVGSLQALITVLAGYLLIKHGVPPIPAIFVLVLFGTLAGALGAAIVSILRIPSLIATLALLSVWNGVGLVVSGGNSVYGFPPLYARIGEQDIGPVPVSAVIALSVYIIVWYFVRFTAFGVRIEAVGGNREASRRAGWRPNRVKLQAMAIGGGCAALAGVVLSSRLDAGNPLFGANDILGAISAVVIGGTSLFGGRIRIWGTLIGVIILTSIGNGLNVLGVTPFWQPIAVGAMLVFAVGVDQLTSRRVEARR
jgi:ribose transport system permease protein